MIRFAALAAVVLVLGGCNDPIIMGYRSNPAQQVEDYKTCVSGGMSAYYTQFGEVKCRPPQEAQ